MSDTSFDWHALDGAAPTVHAPARAIPPSRLALFGVAVVLALIATAGGAYLALTAPHPTLAVDGAAALIADGSPDVAAGSIVVDVEGAVARPGLVTLPPGSRVGDAIAAAGGFAGTVDTQAAEGVNLAAPATDGMQIVVPGRSGSGEPASGAPGSSPSPADAAAGGPLDLNHATAAELDTLPGIGPVTAAKIVAARSQAPFTTVEDLQSRKLVGPSTFQKIRDLVTVKG
jgi:competence protein ComEA